jgi:hypothetical protein
MKRFIIVLALAGCGGGDSVSPREACNDLAEIVCGKFYECLTETERDLLQLPASEAACISDLKDQYGCEEQTVDNTCEGSEVYQPDKADDCLDQIARLECGEVRDGDVESDAPACGEVCTIE